MRQLQFLSCSVCDLGIKNLGLVVFRLGVGVALRFRLSLYLRIIKLRLGLIRFETAIDVRLETWIDVF